MTETLDLDILRPSEGPTVKLDGHLWRFKPMVGSQRLSRVQDALPLAKGEVAIMKVLTDFFASVLEPDQPGDWDSMVKADEVAAWQYLEMFRHLVEHYGNRPTDGSSTSSATPGANGTTSTAPGPSAASTSQPTLPISATS